MRLSNEPLLAAETIQRRVAELAGAISADFAGEHLVLVVVLKGAAVFAADLMRQLRVQTGLEFVRAQSYEGSESTGTVTLTHRPETSLTGKHVLVIEDILDTGRTAAAVWAYLERESPARMALCALLDKPARRAVEMPGPYYAGFTIEDRFVVGYGLDYEQQYRQLPGVWTLEPD